MSGTPELDNLMGEQKSDVLFVVEGRKIPALISSLSAKSQVFENMFSGNFKESKDKEIPIEDTTYDAFNTFVGFLNSKDLFIDFDNDFQLISKLYKLSDRYDVSQLADRITDELIKRNQLNAPKYLSEEEFQWKWPKIRSITRIAIESQSLGLIEKVILRLIENVMTFIDKNFDHFMNKNYNELIGLNDLTNGRLFNLMENKCTKGSKEKNISQIIRDFKELKDKEEDITYEAFKTLIRFLYSNLLVFDGDHFSADNNFEMIRELYKLSDEYKLSRLEDRITDELTERYSLEGPDCRSENRAHYQKKWRTIKLISRIAYDLTIQRLKNNVNVFLQQNYEYISREDMKDLTKSTDDRLFFLG